MWDLIVHPVLAAGAVPPFFGDIAALGAVSVGIAYACYRLHLAPIAGFLIAGVIIGPNAFAIVEDLELVNRLAEIGVILLLFTIGIEFSLEKLARIKTLVLGAGSLQVVITVAVVTGLCLALGIDLRSSIFTGLLVSLSSTAIVLGLLADRGETDSPTGQGALGILIFQDLAIIVMVLLMPLIGGQGGSTVDLLLALGKALLIITAVVVLARNIVPPLLDRVAATRRPELFLLTVVAICFTTAWVLGLADVSLALGAFLAGLIVSESPYSTQALSEILPLRTVFNAAFFVSVGMLLDVRVLLDSLPLILGVVATILVLKTLITAGSLLALKMPLRIATGTGLLMAQIGEFSFVLDVAGREAGLSPAGLGEFGQQIFIAATVLLMIGTPFLADLGPKLGRLLERLVGRVYTPPVGPVDGEVAGHGIGLEDHVIVVGYGPSGRRLVHVLRQTDIPFVIVDLNPQSINEAKAEGLPAVYGDATRPHVLEVVGIDRAKTLVVGINDRNATTQIVRVAAYENPIVQIIARADFVDDIDRLHEAGAEIVIPAELETAVRLFAEVLNSYQVPAEDIRHHAQQVRADDYELMRVADTAQPMVLEGFTEQGVHTRVVTVDAGMPAANETLGTIDLRQQYGVTVLTVERDDQTISNPDGDFRLEPGDRLVLLGSSDCFIDCADIFRSNDLAPTPDAP